MARLTPASYQLALSQADLDIKEGRNLQALALRDAYDRAEAAEAKEACHSEIVRQLYDEIATFRQRLVAAERMIETWRVRAEAYRQAIP